MSNSETTPKVPTEYLGDGVYADFDGYHIVLKANNHEHPTDIIALEPAVLVALNRFITKIKDEI